MFLLISTAGIKKNSMKNKKSLLSSMAVSPRLCFHAALYTYTSFVNLED